MNFTFLGFSGLVNFLTCVSLGLFVLLNDPRSNKNRSYFYLNSSVALYSFGYFLWQLSMDEISALFWFKILAVGIIFINVTYLHFVFTFVGVFKEKRKELIVYYLINIIFIFLNIKGYLYSSLEPRYNLGYWPVPTFVFHIYLVFWFWQCFYGFGWLLKGLSHTVGLHREQIKYFTLSAIIGFTGGATNWPMWYKVHLPPYPNILISIYIGVVAYAIVRHRLMNINVAITRGTVFAIVYAFVLGIPVGVGFWGRSYLSDAIGTNWWLVPVGITLILATLGPTIYTALRRRTERERRRYQENLIALAKQMTLTKDLRGLLVLIIRNVTREIGISHARIYLLDKEVNEYVREVRYGKERRRQFFGDSLSKDAPLIQMLSKSRDRGPLLREEVIGHFETSEREYLEEVKAQLRSMGAAILLPAFIGEELVAFLALGTKRSKEIYTPDDLGMFKILAGQAGLAIENAQFYQELKDAQATMLQAAKLSSIGELAAGFAHQIDNPLGIISLGSQLCVREITEDLGKENLSEKGKEVVQKLEDRLGKIIETAHRAADLVERIRGYAKPSDRDFEPTDLNSVMEDALGLAEYRISRGGINVTKNIPQDLPKMKGIGVQLEQVFLNIIMNACEAMAGKKGELAISAGVGKENPDRVEIGISDNGSGIPKGNLNKLFELFFTTKGAQGTGVGLSMAYRIIKDHNGDIDVESEVGKGSKFTISLPIWEEKS